MTPFIISGLIDPFQPSFPAKCDTYYNPPKSSYYAEYNIGEAHTVSLIGGVVWHYRDKSRSKEWKNLVRDFLTLNKIDYCYTTVDPHFGVEMTEFCHSLQIPYIVVCPMEKYWLYDKLGKDHRELASFLVKRAARVIITEPEAQWLKDFEPHDYPDQGPGKERYVEGIARFVWRNKWMVKQADATCLIVPKRNTCMHRELSQQIRMSDKPWLVITEKKKGKR